MRLTRFVALALPTVAAACGGARTPTPTPTASAAGATTPAITPADLKARIAIFADDSMLGRRAGTVGNVRGNAYIAGQLAHLGLAPMGDSGSFLQRVPLTSYALDSAKATLHAGSATLAPFTDYFPYQPTYAIPARDRKSVV